MAVKQSDDRLQSPASQQLSDFLQVRRQAWQQGVPDFEQFERELHEQILNLEREYLAEDLARYDVEAEQIEVGGLSYQPVLQAAETYLSAAGPVRVQRHLYRPAGRNTIGCGTLTLYDREGERLQTLRYARMPEPKKVTLAAQLHAEAHAILGARPDLRRVYLADGADSNWELLAELERTLGGNPAESLQIVDFYHACEHLKGGCDAIWGESTARGQAEFARLRVLLKEADDGAEQILRTLKYHRGRATGSRRKRIRAALTYFRNQRGRMHYAAYQRQHLPIGSGVVEAACKTLVTQRLKGSGMAWTMAGGQAILTLRSLLQSGRWAQAWPLLAADFRTPVVIPDTNTEAPLRLAA